MKQETVNFMQVAMHEQDHSQRADARLTALIGAIGAPEVITTELSTAFAGWLFPSPAKKQGFKRLCRRHFQRRFPALMLIIKGNLASVSKKGDRKVDHNGDVITPPLQSSRQLETELAKLERENRELLGMTEESIPKKQVKAAISQATADTSAVAQSLKIQVQRLEREKAVMADEYSGLVAAILDKTVTRNALRGMVAA